MKDDASLTLSSGEVNAVKILHYLDGEFTAATKPGFEVSDAQHIAVTVARNNVARKYHQLLGLRVSRSVDTD